MLYLFQRMMRSIFRTGRLTIIDPADQSTDYGDGSGEHVVVRIKNHRTIAKLLIHSDLYLGEAYVDGSLVVEKGSIYDLLALATDNLAKNDPIAALVALRVMRTWVRRLQEYNPIGRARQNVAHHYDLSGELYDLFLDRDRQYSCGYFETPNASLAQAQLAKKRHLAAKLDIKPDMRVLDIGSGWGGMGLYLAEVCGAKVTGVTLSEEQHRLSNARAQQRGIDDRVRFELLDYRQLDDQFDRIISVGMFEHVGVGHYGEFFDHVHDLLKPDGVACLHSISRANGPAPTSAWISKYIFPGGSMPALSEVTPHIESSGLYVTDIEIWRMHYAETLRHWRKRFADHRDRAKEIYDERFCRMWEFYLAGSECSFRFDFLNNFQIQMTRDRDVLPLTRDYISREEERLRLIDSKRRQLASVQAR
ncbi:MAG: class I SAM-dependent methyltransferase [Aestuariivirgaceae bacterium]